MKHPELNPAACLGKERFDSATLAHQVAQRSQRKIRSKMKRVRNPYRCGTCGGWHLGSPKQ